MDLDAIAKFISNPWMVLILALFSTTISGFMDRLLKKTWTIFSDIFRLGNTKLNLYLKNKEKEKDELLSQLRDNHEYRLIYAFNIVYCAMVVIVCFLCALTALILYNITHNPQMLYFIAGSYFAFTFSIGKTKSILHDLWKTTPGKWPGIYKF